MSKSLKITLVASITVFLIFFTLLVVSNALIKNKLENFTHNKLPDHISANYEDLEVHLLTGTLTYSDVTVVIKNNSDQKIHTRVVASQITIENLSYWKYLFQKKIHIDNIKILDPEITYASHKLSRDTLDGTAKKQFLKLYKPLYIDELSINHAKVIMYDGSKDSTLLYAPNITLDVENIYIDKKIAQRRLPLEFGDYHTTSDSIFLKISSHENITANSLNIKDRQAIVKDIRLFTRYSSALQYQNTAVERDHYDAYMKDLAIQNIDFGFSERTFFAMSSYVIANAMDATIYRNKLLPDDPTHKQLYSAMLRNLPIALSIDSMSVNNSSVTYEEKVKADQPPGKIYFENIYVTSKKLSNMYNPGQQTHVAIDAQFMKTSSLQVDLNFDVNDKSDAFVLKAELGSLQADQLNSFTKPNLLLSLEGEIDQTYFSIYGNKSSSKIDMRVKYDNFKVNLLSKKGREKKKLLSGLVNIFVKKESSKDQDGFANGNATVTPDRTKSFFNYIWLNVSDGLKDCFL